MKTNLIHIHQGRSLSPVCHDGSDHNIEPVMPGISDWAIVVINYRWPSFALIFALTAMLHEAPIIVVFIPRQHKSQPCHLGKFASRQLKPQNHGSIVCLGHMSMVKASNRPMLCLPSQCCRIESAAKIQIGTTQSQIHAIFINANPVTIRTSMPQGNKFVPSTVP